MKHFRKEIMLHVPARRGFVNITREVEAAIQESGIKNWLLLCNARVC